jgi:hypothetical protein
LTQPPTSGPRLTSRAAHIARESVTPERGSRYVFTDPAVRPAT